MDPGTKEASTRCIQVRRQALYFTTVLKLIKFVDYGHCSTDSMLVQRLIPSLLAPSSLSLVPTPIPGLDPCLYQCSVIQPARVPSPGPGPDIVCIHWATSAVARRVAIQQVLRVVLSASPRSSFATPIFHQPCSGPRSRSEPRSEKLPNGQI